MNQSAADAQRASRLLRNLRKVLNHDLPNQVIVVHGLLQLLKLDEKSRMTPEGQEYLIRSESACKRVLHMLETVKKILDIDGLPLDKEAISLADLLRELMAAAKQMFNSGPIEIAPLPVKTMTAPRAALHQALLQLVSASRPASSQAKVRIAVAATPDNVEFWIGPAQLETPGSAKPLTLENTKGVENRLALMYVQELAESWGGSLKGNADEASFFLNVPQ